MKKLFHLLILFAFSISTSYAQNILFQETFTIGNAPASGEAIAPTTDNDFVIAGETNVNGNAESFLTRLTAEGAIEWTKIYYDEQSHIFVDNVNDTEIFCNAFLKFVLPTADEGFILGGGLDSAVTITYPNGAQVGSDFFRMYLMKVDENGNLTWAKKYALNDFDGAAAIAEASNGGYYVAAYAHQTGSVVTDDLFMRLDANGNVIWSKSFGGSGSEGVSDLRKTDDGHYILCGTSESFSNNQNIYVVKMDTSGNVLWSKTYGSTGFDYGKSILPATDGGFYVYGNAGTGNPSYIAIIKTDASGNLNWSYNYGNSFADGPSKLMYAKDGNLVALADHYTGQYDGFIIRIDTSGNPIANRAFGKSAGSNNDFIRDVLPLQNGYLLTGTTNSFSGNQFIYDGYLIRTDLSLFSSCYSDSINSEANMAALTVSGAATAVNPVAVNYYPMNITQMDSNFADDTLCASVFTSDIPSNHSDFGISLYPNPANDVLEIRTEFSLYSIGIFNMLGGKVNQIETGSSKQVILPVSDLPAGIYFLEIHTDHGNSTRRFSIVR